MSGDPNRQTAMSAAQPLWDIRTRRHDPGHRTGPAAQDDVQPLIGDRRQERLQTGKTVGNQNQPFAGRTFFQFEQMMDRVWIERIATQTEYGLGWIGDNAALV